MLIASGIVLVLVTWLALILLLALAGLLVALLIQRGSVTVETLRRALWWGLTLVTLAVLAGSVVAPIRSTEFALSLVVGIVILSGSGIALAWRRGWQSLGKRGRHLWLTGIPLVLAAVTLAGAALGPVNNYDTGLYHLGAISYAADFSAVPGLANLYQPLGYATAQFPLAAAMGIGPWGDDGFRLLNGLIITLVASDLAFRFLRKRTTPGTWIQLVTVSTLLVSMVALADYWVTSPSQDAAVFALTIVAVAYLADAIATKTEFAANGATAIAIAVLTVLIRPTMAFFAATLVAALVMRMWAWRGQEWPANSTAAVILSLAVGGTALALSTARDYLLSGWFQYPLSLFSFDVPWRAGDPSPLRDATLGFHRNPEDLWGSVSGYEWVGPWFSRATSQWEAWLVVVMIVAAGALLLIARAKYRIEWRLLGLSMLPSAVAVTAWFLASPPAFRFAWGPLVTLAAIPAGWGLWQLINQAGIVTWKWIAILGFAVSVAGVSVFTMVTRIPWAEISQERQWAVGVSIPYAVAAVQTPDVQAQRLPSGLEILVPLDSELCWEAFPLCTPRTAESLRFAGEDIQSGFLQ